MAKNTQSSAKVSGSIGVTTGHVAEWLKLNGNPVTNNATPAEQMLLAQYVIARLANGLLREEEEDTLFYEIYNAGMDTISSEECPRL
tara:strand:- start:2181 stop:2441 length:261 start_codon:yes stop_codon:yes gene_type:complete